MIIAIASDHAAFTLKEKMKNYLKDKNYEVLDFGCNSEESVDYPDFISKAAIAVSQHKADKAVVMCGSGIGASITANKIHSIRAALCMDEYSAKYSRLHNDANVLVLAGRRISEKQAYDFFDIWIHTSFEGGRHQRRLDKIADIEKKECKNLTDNKE